MDCDVVVIGGGPAGTTAASLLSRRGWNVQLFEERQAYARAARRYGRSVNRGLNTFCWFIYRFTTPAMHSLFGKPRNVLRLEQAVISMLAGDVYQNRAVRLRLALFKTVYAATRLLVASRSRAAIRA